MQITAFTPPPADSTAAPQASPRTAPTTGAGGQTGAAPAASSIVTLSSEGQQLAASTTSKDLLTLPDLDGIASIEQAMAAIPDPIPSRAHIKTALERKKEKESSLIMLDVDGFRNLRDKLKAKLEQRPETPALQLQQQDDAKSG